MPSTNVTITITAPDLQEALRLFTDHHGWTEDDGTRGAFAKATIARKFREDAISQKKMEAKEAAVGSVTEDIQTE